MLRQFWVFQISFFTGFFALHAQFLLYILENWTKTSYKKQKQENYM